MNSSELNVVFGTGPVAMAVMRELVKQGKRVRMVNRSGKADVPAGVEVIKSDLYDLSKAREAASSAAVVYQCAQPAYTEWTTKFMPLQATILEAAAFVGAKLVIADNLYMYGHVNGPMTEDLPYAAHTRKGKTRAEMALAALDAHKAGKVRVTIGRAADFFGAGVFDSAVGERVFPNTLQGKGVTMIGDLDMPHTYTYINDFGRGLVTLGEHDAALGRAWHVPSAETLTTREFVSMVFEEAGFPAKVSSAPALVLKAMGLFMPILREVVEMMYQFEEPFVLDHGQFTRTFGQTPITPHREAIRQTLAWYRQHMAAKAA
ncbi:MAG: NAD-dependent epimerase/dehydratase family protein [Burkholderiales bacterium]|nr:NAD-dependent epimerase/dehydratase family protein [Anaerolineae bacterium]